MKTYLSLIILILGSYFSHSQEIKIYNDSSYEIDLFLGGMATLPPYNDCSHNAVTKIQLLPQSLVIVYSFDNPSPFDTNLWNSSDFGSQTGSTIQNVYGQAKWTIVRIYDSTAPNCCGALWGGCMSPPTGYFFDNGSFKGTWTNGLNGAIKIYYEDS